MMRQLELGFIPDEIEPKLHPVAQDLAPWNMHQRINLRGYCKRCGYLFPVSAYEVSIMGDKNSQEAASHPYYINHWAVVRWQTHPKEYIKNRYQPYA